MAGAIAWRAEYAGEVLEMLRTLMEQAPPALVCVAGLRIAPPGSGPASLLNSSTTSASRGISLMAFSSVNSCKFRRDASLAP
jgi:hypothetical protein